MEVGILQVTNTHTRHRAHSSSRTSRGIISCRTRGGSGGQGGIDRIRSHVQSCCGAELGPLRSQHRTFALRQTLQKEHPVALACLFEVLFDQCLGEMELGEMKTQERS